MALCPQAGGLAVATEGLILQPHVSVCSQWGHSQPQAPPPPRSQREAPKGMGPGSKMSPGGSGSPKGLVNAQPGDTGHSRGPSHSH